MNGKFYGSNKYNGYLYGGANNASHNTKEGKNKEKNKRMKEDDLIIEDNTVYEIDRECYERLMRKRRNKR